MKNLETKTKSGYKNQKYKKKKKKQNKKDNLKKHI